MDRKDFLREIRDKIQKLEPKAEIYLFGSRARGDFNINSDWDVLVISPQKKIKFDYEIRLREPLFNLELETGELISLIIYTSEDWETKKSISPLFNNVLKEGVKI